LTETDANEEMKTSRTQRFAEWLMRREEQRAEKESSLEGLIKLNVLVSFLTLGLVGGFEAVQLGISLIPYL
tara:strand:+ start:686 stop:898 length:213 start_codon:yes stop_codon:yes gene_type:complete